MKKYSLEEIRNFNPDQVKKFKRSYSQMIYKDKNIDYYVDYCKKSYQKNKKYRIRKAKTNYHKKKNNKIILWIKPPFNYKDVIKYYKLKEKYN